MHWFAFIWFTSVAKFDLAVSRICGKIATRYYDCLRNHVIDIRGSLVGMYCNWRANHWFERSRVWIFSYRLNYNKARWMYAYLMEG